MASYYLKNIEINGSRAKITLAEYDEKLILSVDSLAEYSLSVGSEISEGMFNQLLRETNIYLCRQKALTLLSYREHSVGEMKRKLYIKKFPGYAIKIIVENMVQENLLNDERYANKLAHKYVENKPSGKSPIIAHLINKLIDSKTALSAADEALIDIDMAVQAETALNKRWSRYAQLELEDARKKSYTYLSRRGFGFEAAKKAFEKLRTTEED